jgi:hypothetical protein
LVGRFQILRAGNPDNLTRRLWWPHGENRFAFFVAHASVNNDQTPSSETTVKTAGDVIRARGEFEDPSAL